MNPYVGNEMQLHGVIEYTLHGGYKEDVKMLHIFNDAGLDMRVSLDRNADIVSLSYKGKNVSYITPNGISHHHDYEPIGDGWIKHFTAGFLTTCGYQNVGRPCQIDGVDYPMHGSINYVPVDHYSYEIDDKQIIVKFVVLDELIFSRKIKRTRLIKMNLFDGKFLIEDEIENRGDLDIPLLYLYHINIGYPMLKEDCILEISHDKVTAINEISNKHIDTALIMEKPTPNFIERVYYYENKSGKGYAKITSPSEKMSLSISYDSIALPYLIEWKMMGVRDYVLGLEPANVTTVGFKEHVEQGKKVTYIKSNQKLHYQVDFEIKEIK